jgi:hypothetical protein
MREKKHSIINDTASLSNIIAAGLTCYHLLLLPIVSQELQETVNYAHKQIEQQRNDCQATRDFDLFIKTNSSIIDDINRIKTITERIDLLQNSFTPAVQQKINEDSTFYMQQFKKNISELEKRKRCYEEGIIYMMDPFFRRYSSLSVPDFLDENKKQLKKLEKLFYCSRGSRLCSLPLAALPLMFRDASNEGENFLDAFAAGAGLSLCTIPYAALMILPAEGLPLSIQLPYWISMILSMKAAVNNADASLALRNKIYDQSANLEYAIKILEIQLAHLRKPETILKRSL